MTKTAIAIRHVHFEDLGAFEPVLRDAGYQIRYCDIGLDEPAAIAPNTDLLVVLGAPISAYEEEKYPFLIDELRLIGHRLSVSLPVLGICLGAQLMARALGAPVYPGKSKEIGWAPIDLADAVRGTPLHHLAGLPVLHWHGDTFDLPEGAVRLASTAITLNQAFAAGSTALGLQFHVEVEERGFERWLIGHTLEISTVPNLSVSTLRRDARTNAARTAAAGARMLRDWLESLTALQ
ncbi:MAG: glutamine amidotransferase [Alphaproteobacteria bacterium]|nr:glutamine amidotransferase [Alphaproteobacteria bacterium]